MTTLEQQDMNATITLSTPARIRPAQEAAPSSKHSRQIQKLKDMGYEVHITHLRQFKRTITVPVNHEIQKPDQKVYNSEGRYIGLSAAASEGVWSQIGFEEITDPETGEIVETPIMEYEGEVAVYKNCPAVMLQKHHQTSNMKLCSAGGMTIISLVNRGADTAIPNRLVIESECCENDNFCRKTGTGIAIGRIEKKLGMEI